MPSTPSARILHLVPNVEWSRNCCVFAAPVSLERRIAVASAFDDGEFLSQLGELT